MLHNPDGRNHRDGDARKSDQRANRSQPWWLSINNASISNEMLNETHINLFSKHTEEDGTSGRMEEPHRLKTNENLVSTIPLQLIFPSAPCSSNPHKVPGYGGAQSWGHSSCTSRLRARMVLPLQMAEEPVYVNAKQYHGILRRRQSRAKMELERKETKVKRPYIHESRHLHAMKRERGCGGRFLSKNIVERTNRYDSSKDTRTENIYFDDQDEVKQLPIRELGS